MRPYYVLALLFLVIGLLFMPSAHLSVNAPATGKSKQQSAGKGRFKTASTALTIKTVDTADDFIGDCGTPGNCTLRTAIAEGNETPDLVQINFNISPSGPKTINLVSPLTQINRPMIIDGTTQPGGTGGPNIELNGTSAGPGDGLVIGGGASTTQIKGLIINRIDGNGITVNAGECVISGNYIGTAPDGLTARPNTGAGVLINDTNSNTIGGGQPADGNVIAFNNIGVSILSSGFDGSGNAILLNSIFQNTGLGIDLNADGVTPNDPCDEDLGANLQQNFPVLTSATTTGSSITIQGTLNSVSEDLYQIDFFASPTGDPSLNGEGQTFIGSTMVTTASDCEATFSPTFVVAVPSGQFITATATGSFNDTSEFSAWILATSVTCNLTCPEDITTTSFPDLCGAVVDYPPPGTAGMCSSVTCNPPSGSLFPPGTTVVTCLNGSTPACSFNITVTDNQPPTIQCPANISVSIDPGQQSKAVQYNFPVVNDNCGLVKFVTCSPPSGSQFPAGTTTVTCSTSDSSGNNASCSFTISVLDSRPPVITCPANITVQSTAQCTAVVNYPAPTVTGTVGAIVTCTPPSGTTFPSGTTAVNCVAVSSTGTRVTCGFNVTVNGLSTPRVIFDGGASGLDFGQGPASRKSDPDPTLRSFMIENTGCASLSLAYNSTMRTGSDVENGKITNPDDSATFPLSVVNANGTETLIGGGSGTTSVTIAAGQKLTFRVRFNRVVPPYAGKTTGLSAREALPDLVTSKITFTPAGGAAFSIPLTGRVSPQAQLINDNNAKKKPKVSFERSGNEFVVTIGFYDPNLNTSRIRYELLRGDGSVAETVEVDVAGAINSINPVKGQSLIVEQRFTGASDNSNVVGVRVTLIDGEGSDTRTTSSVVTTFAATSSQKLQARADVVYLPRTKINLLLP